MSDLIWVLEKGVIQEGGEILGIWTGPNARDAAVTRFDQVAWTVNSDQNATERDVQGPGALHVSGRNEWLSLTPYENGWTR
jgi:hypothetical protein